MRSFLVVICTSLVLGVTFSGSVSGQDAKLQQAMSYQPFQEGVTYDRPGGNDLTGLRLTNAESIGQVGFLVRDDQEQMLRRFVDSDGDKRLDTWAYYSRGVEVYRDVDTNQDTKPDQFYWLGPEGSRIGKDIDQDREIDQWIKISPQELTMELVRALKERKASQLKALFLTPGELDELKLGEAVSKRIGERLEESTRELETQIQQLSIDQDAQWLHFGAPFPGALVNEDAESIDVFDSVSTLFSVGGENRQLSVGSMVKVGDAWRLIEFPTLPGRENAVAVGGLFFQSGNAEPAMMATAETDGGVNVETLNAYQAAEDEFREKYGKVEGKALADLHQKRAKALLAIAVSSPGDRENWARQYADIVSAAYQSGEYPEGLEELEASLETMKKEEFPSGLIAYTRYRILNAWYSRSAEQAEDLDELQDQWTEKLNAFIDQYPKDELAAEALFELAKIDDYLGDIESAEETYKRIVSTFPDSSLAARAKGAVVRLTSEGREIPFQGQTVNGQPFSLARLKGKMVLIHYWATWCEPCKAEFPEMKELYAKYKKDGFEIVSISLDEERDSLMGYLQQQDLPWMHLYEEGGLEESPLASQLGVIALPTMLLVDKDGSVLDRGATLQQVERELRKLK